MFYVISDTGLARPDPLAQYQIEIKIEDQALVFSALQTLVDRTGDLLAFSVCR